MSANDVARLGRLVKARREELGLTQAEVDRRGGPSETKLGQIENGTGTVALSTLKKLDVALDWAPGSAKAVLDDGGDPTPTVRGQELTVDLFGKGVSPEVLAELRDLEPSQVQRVVDFVRGIKAGGSG